MSDGMTLVQNEDGSFSAYDDTYDIVIHCETEEEQKKAIKRLKSTNWIPIDERLPDPDKHILVSFFNFSQPAADGCCRSARGTALTMMTAEHSELVTKTRVLLNMICMSMPGCHFRNRIRKIKEFVTNEREEK